jgi:AraC family transcriptional regulator
MEQQSKLFIKGMVCNRCVMVIHEVLADMGYQSVKVELGEITFPENSYFIDMQQLEERLAINGFSVLEDRNAKTINEIKNLVAEVYSGDFDFPEKFRFSNLLYNRLNKAYEPARDIFIAMQKQSLEQYIIEYRINKVKELLVYSTLTLADIAFRLNFTSVAHLSTQFKQQTGLTPSFFRGIKNQKADVIFSVN